MKYVPWLIAGGLLGGILSIITGRNAGQRIPLDVRIESVGTFLVGLFPTLLFGLSLILTTSA